MIERLKSKGLSVGHIFDTTGYTYTVTPFSSEGMKAELENMLLEENVTLLYHSVVIDAEIKNKNVLSVTAYGAGQKKKINARVFIDASGDGNLAYLSGAELTKGRECDGKCQPMTMNFKLSNVNIEHVKNYIMNNNSEFPRLKGELDKVTKAPRLSIGGYVDTLNNARLNGKISFEREDILFFETDKQGEVIVNTTRIIDKDPTVASDLTLAEIEGRKQAWQVYSLLKKVVKGFEKCELEFTGPFIGVRSSRQLKGLHTLSAMDIVSCKRFDDSIVCGAYPIDVHSPDGKDENMYEETKLSLKYGDIYHIPYRSLVCDKLNNIIVVGRCISADFEAQAAIRVSPNAGAIGQAGGTAAAICAIEGIAVQNIDTAHLRAELKKQGMYLQ